MPQEDRNFVPVDFSGMDWAEVEDDSAAWTLGEQLFAAVNPKPVEPELRTTDRPIVVAAGNAHIWGEASTDYNGVKRSLWLIERGTPPHIVSLSEDELDQLIDALRKLRTDAAVTETNYAVSKEFRAEQDDYAQAMNKAAGMAERAFRKWEKERENQRLAEVRANGGGLPIGDGIDQIPFDDGGDDEDDE